MWILQTADNIAELVDAFALIIVVAGAIRRIEMAPLVPVDGP